MALLARNPADNTGYQSTGSAKFIPQLWSGKMVVKFYTKTVFGEISNTDYEGEIKDYGDSVVINTIPSITIRDYTFGDPTGGPGTVPGNLQYEKPTSANVLLEINRAKYFAFECNDIEKFQSKPILMDTFSDDAGEQLTIAIDSDVLSNAYLEAGHTGDLAGPNANINLGTNLAPLVITKSNVIDFLVETVGTLMDELDFPDSDRWIILPSAITSKIKTSELKDASMTGDSQSTLRNGKVGMIDRLHIYRSNQIHRENGEYHVMAGHKSALTFAMQMAKTETLKNPFDFGDLVRGLNVYGYKVVKPAALIHCQIAI